MQNNFNLLLSLRAIHRSLSAKFNCQKGFTLLELMIVVAIMGVLAAIAIPNFISYRERAHYAAAIAEMRQIETGLNVFFITFNRYPVNLTEAGFANLNDPWGTPYQYLEFSNVIGKGAKRKNKATNPVNTDFDLYSMGPDRQSKLPFTVPVSFDDIVRANNGAFFGRVADY